MMLNRARPALVCAIWMTATAAMAQTPLASTPQPTPVAPVTVNAAPSPAQSEKQVASFVKSYAASTAKLDQIARWRDPLCLQITGVTPVEAYQVQARVEEMTKAVGRRVLQAGCRPNVEIKFTADPQTLLDSIAQSEEAVLGYSHRQDARVLKTVTRPVQSWYMTATLGGGAPSAGAMFAGVGGNRFDSEIVDDPDSQSPKGCADSHFTSCLQSVFKHVLVVVDSGRVRGYSPGQAADYVAMLILSQPRSLDGCNILPSVLDLFAACPGREAPGGLTRADAAYLTALYAADPEAKKTSQQTEIASRMARILASGKTIALVSTEVAKAR